MTELVFRDVTHLHACMTSRFVTERVGPDAVSFADFEMSISVMAYEKLLQSPAEAKGSNEGEVTALLFLSPRDKNPNGDGVEMIVSPAFLSLLQQYAGNRLRLAVVNVGVEIPGLDPREYFGGKDMPYFSLVYKIHLTGGRDAIPIIRKFEAALQDNTSKEIDWSYSFTVFGYEAVVLDQEKGIAVSAYCNYCANVCLLKRIADTLGSLIARDSPACGEYCEAVLRVRKFYTTVD